GREHQAVVAHPELVGEQLGVPGPEVAAHVHGGLVQRRGDDPLHQTALGQIDRLDDEAGGPVPGAGVELAVALVPQGGAGRGDVDGCGAAGRRPWVGAGVYRVRVGTDGGDGPA